MNLIVTTLFLEVALILVPGFIWLRIHRAYGIKHEATPFDTVINSFIFSIITYLVLAAIYWLKGWKLQLLLLDSEDKRLIHPEIIPEILGAVGLSVALSIIWLYVINYKIVTRFVQIIKATRTYGDEDVWDFIFNSRSPFASFVHVRDFEQQVVYAGDVRIFSESEKLRELILENAKVFDFDGVPLYEVPILYLSRNPEGVHIEFPSISDRLDDNPMASYSYTFPGRGVKVDETPPVQ